MGAIVTADYVIGSKTRLTTAKIKRVIKALGIVVKDPNKLPTGKDARYILVMETLAPTPSVAPVPMPTAAKRAKRKRRI
jgi:hypothetical protein